MSRNKRFLVITVKLFVTAALLYLVLSGVNYETLWQIVSRATAYTIVLAIAFHVIAFLIGGFRWWLLMRYAGSGPSFVAIVPSYYLGMFFNNFLPTGVGGDLVRILHLKGRQMSLRALVSSTIGDRLIGLAVVLGTGLVALALSSDIHLDHKTSLALGAIVATAVTGGWLFASDRFGGLLDRLTQRYEHTRRRHAILDVIRTIHGLRSKKLLLLQTAALSLAMQSCVIATYYVLGRGIGLDYPLLIYFVIIPVVFLATSLPISVGGLGVREGALVALLMAMGTEKQIATSLSILYLAVLWMSSLPGAMALLTTPVRTLPPSETT